MFFVSRRMPLALPAAECGSGPGAGTGLDRLESSISSARSSKPSAVASAADASAAAGFFLSRRSAVDRPPRDEGLVLAPVGGLRAHARPAGAAAASSAVAVGPTSSSAIPRVLPSTWLPLGLPLRLASGLALGLALGLAPRWLPSLSLSLSLSSGSSSPLELSHEPLLPLLEAPA